jgi:hypothetical protein
VFVLGHYRFGGVSDHVDGWSRAADCFGHWKVVHLRNRISAVCVALYGYLQHFLHLIFAAKNEVHFFRVRIAKCHKNGLLGQSSLQ